jgi:hypothetical protein
VIAELLATPLRVRPYGRPGVGTSTVAGALRLAGLAVCSDSQGGDSVDIGLRVIAEVAKPEDRDNVEGGTGPALMVLTKADLAGFGAGGPLAAGRRHCDRLQTLTGVPVVPVAALLAVAGLDDTVLDDTLLGALRTLVTEPADLRSTDGFIAGEHQVARAVRIRLIERLDLFGIAHAVAALRQDGTDPSTLRAVLRARSGIDELVAAIDAAGAEVRYRRALCAVAHLESLAAIASHSLSKHISSFLCADETVMARMAAAVEVVTAAGLDVDAADDGQAHIRRAVRWRRYGRGPVTPLHGACGADIARGSLRLLGGLG